MKLSAASASRTTRLLALVYFSEFFGLVLDRPFKVDNPFIFKTKAKVVALIARHGGKDLIGWTCSCSHQGIFTPKTQLHCGACGQCIDRRVAVIAAGVATNDPETDYRTTCSSSHGLTGTIRTWGSTTFGTEWNFAVRAMKGWRCDSTVISAGRLGHSQINALLRTS